MCDQTVFVLKGDEPRMVMGSVEKIEAKDGAVELVDIFGEIKRLENVVFHSMENNRFYLKTTGVN